MIEYPTGKPKYNIVYYYTYWGYNSTWYSIIKMSI